MKSREEAFPHNPPEYEPVVKKAEIAGLEFFHCLYGGVFIESCEYCGNRNPLGPNTPCPHCGYVQVEPLSKKDKEGLKENASPPGPNRTP